MKVILLIVNKTTLSHLVHRTPRPHDNNIGRIVKNKQDEKEYSTLNDTEITILLSTNKYIFIVEDLISFRMTNNPLQAPSFEYRVHIRPTQLTFPSSVSYTTIPSKTNTQLGVYKIQLHTYGRC